jgi:formylmethanofuran dehydrogenase subunit E
MNNIQIAHTRELVMARGIVGRFAACLVATFVSASAMAETPEEWVKLGARVHGGFGAFIPVGIKIGLDAVATLNAQPRQLAVTYYDNPKSPCACFADGVAIATVASVGQRTITIAPDKAPDHAAAVIVIRPRQGGQGLRYVIPMSALPKLAEMNKTLEPLARYHAVMKADGLFTRAVEP